MLWAEEKNPLRLLSCSGCRVEGLVSSGTDCGNRGKHFRPTNRIFSPSSPLRSERAPCLFGAKRLERILHAAEKPFFLDTSCLLQCRWQRSTRSAHLRIAEFCSR